MAGRRLDVAGWKHVISFLSRRKNRDGESYKTKVSGFTGWVREPCQARKDFADSMYKLKLEGLDVQAIVEFIPYHEGFWLSSFDWLIWSLEMLFLVGQVLAYSTKVQAWLAKRFLGAMLWEVWVIH